MIKTLRYTFMAVIALICGSMSAQEVQPEVTLDFTSNDTWKLPVKDAMGKTEQTFTMVLTLLNWLHLTATTTTLRTNSLCLARRAQH